MRKVIRLEPGPLSSETIANLKLQNIYLLESDLLAEEVLNKSGVPFTFLADKPLPVDAAILIPSSPLDQLVYVVDRLLGPGGCPWDQAQTHTTLKKYLLEEAYEVLDAIDSGDPDQLQEELGDLILQPVLHGQISKANGGLQTPTRSYGTGTRSSRRKKDK